MYSIKAGTAFSGFLTRERAETVVFCFCVGGGGMVECWGESGLWTDIGWEMYHDCPIGS